MHPFPDMEFGWIRDGRQELLSSGNPNWRGNFVSHLLPTRFEAYAKILHCIDAAYDNIDDPLSERETALLKIPPCAALRSYVEAHKQSGHGPRIRWKSLTQLLNVPYEAEICHEWFRTRLKDPTCWPRFLRGPDEGKLSEEELAELVSILRSATKEQECFFRFAEIPFLGTGKPILFCGALEELVGFLNNGKYQFSPEYWWSADHSWCLCTDYDLVFTMLAGPKTLISAVLSSPSLEALEVRPNIRIDWQAPIPE